MKDELRQAIDTIPGFVWSALPDGSVDFLNQRWCDYTGVSLQDACGQGWRSAIHPEDLPQLADYWSSLLKSREPGEVEARLRRSDGTFRWFLIRAVPLYDESGRVVKWYGQNTDIEDRKRAETLLAGEKRLLEMVALGSELPTVLNALCTLVNDASSGCHCSILLVEPNGSSVRHAAAPSLPSHFSQAIDGRSTSVPYWGPCAMAIDQKTPVIVSDIGQDTRWDNFEWCTLALAVGLRSCWTTPILSQAGTPLGTFAIYQREVGSPNSLQTDLIGRFTHVASIAVERAQAEEALRRSQAQLERAQRLSTTGSFSYRAATDELTLSEETCRICGFDPSKPVPPGAMRDRIHPEDLPLFLSMLGGGGRQFEFECRVQLEDSAIKYLHVIADAVRDDAGGLVEWVGAIRDVTERRHVEEERRRHEAILLEAERLSLTGSSCWRPPSDELIWSKEMFRIFDFDPNITPTVHMVRARIHPEDLPHFNQTVECAVRDGQDFAVEPRLLMTDGSIKCLQVLTHAFRDDQGNVIEFMGAVKDVTKQKQVEVELRQSEAFLAEAQRLSSTGSFAWRVSKGEIIWSEQTYRIYEIDPTLPVTFDLVGTRIHPEEASWFQELLGRASSEGRDLEFEHRLQMPDQSIRYLHVVAHATRDFDGQLEYIGAVQDVTERRRSEDAVSKLRSELAHMGRVSTLGALTASIAHEVNQPLAGIITNASTSLLMLADHPPDIEGALESAERTIRDANRASEVISRLRALFKKTTTASESLDLNEATREVLALSMSELQRAQVIVRTELANDLLPVTGDRVQLQQVVLNLVLNAAEAMSAIEDRPRLLVVRTERDEGDRVRLTVCDTGPGFDPQSANRLFETFYTTKRDGMGIGLSISRSIIERHQGRLWAAPSDGPGATFAFSIPRLPVLGRAGKIDGPPIPAVPNVEGMRGTV